MAHKSEPTPRPLLKWAGGKGRLTAQLLSLAPEPDTYTRYVEPFFGGGALFFAIRPNRATLSDANAELMNLYSVVRSNPALFIERIARLASEGIDEESYYRVRAWQPATAVDRAARMMFLNKTSFNGLYRVNRRGIFNVPYGRPLSESGVYSETNIRLVSDVLRTAEIESQDFELTVRKALGEEPRAFVYLDPPYERPTGQASGFTAYTSNGFTWHDQERLRDLVVDSLRETEGRCKFMISNHDTPELRELYESIPGATIRSVEAYKSIAGPSSSRRSVQELVVTTY